MSTPPDLTLTADPPIPPSPPSESAPGSSTDEISRRAFGDGAPAPAHLEEAFSIATGTEPLAPAARFMPRKEWCEFWLKCHGITGQVMGSKVLAGIPERKGMLEAAEAIYDSCVDTPALHWMIAPGGKWFQRAAVVAYAYAPIAGELRAERAARAHPPRNAAPRDPEGSLGDGALGIPPGA